MRLAVMAAVLVLGISAFGLATLGAPTPEGLRPASSVSVSLTPFNGPSCTVRVTGENLQDTAVQSAINTYAATPGSIICLAPGNFPEQLTITGTTDLTILGSGNGSTVLDPSAVTANQVDLDSGLPFYAIIGANNDSGLTIQNLAINGAGSYATVPGCDGFLGIYYANSSGTISRTTVTGINQDNGCQSQNAIFANNGYFTTSATYDQAITISDNTVTNYGKNGITCNDPGLTCTIRENTVATSAMALGYSATNGIQLYGSNGTIAGNSVSGNTYLPSGCTDGDYFFAPTNACPNTADASGILLYAPGNGVNVSNNQLSGNQLGIAAVGGPASVWGNTIASAADDGIVFDFNTSINWLGSPVYATGPFVGTAGDNVVNDANVGLLVYDDNATLVHNAFADTNVSIAVATDLPVAYTVSIAQTTAGANVSGALLGDISSFEPGLTAFPTGSYAITDSTFTNTSASAGTFTPYGIYADAASVTVSTTQVSGFANGAALVASGGVSVSGSTFGAPGTASAGNGLYVYADTASISGNTVSGWSWMTGPGWWPNSQAAGLFAQCTSTCTVADNTVTDSAIGIAVVSSIYGPFPAPSWPYAAAASAGPITVEDNSIVNAGAFGIAFELNQGPNNLDATPAVTISGNVVNNTGTGAVGLMVDQGTYAIDGNTFLGTTLTGSSGASQDTGNGTIAVASIQVLNVNDAITDATLQANLFAQTTQFLAVLNITAYNGFASASFGEAASFSETGLPSYDAWTVDVAGAPLAAFAAGAGGTLDLQNGSYAYTVRSSDSLYAPTVPDGTLTVAGAPLATLVVFDLVTYPIEFSESGLASGTSWSVTVGADTMTTTGTSITFDLANGTYAYSIAPVTDYALADEYSGGITVNGAGSTIDLSFVLQTYQVSFQESGLAPGTSWSVSMASQTYSSTGTSVDFNVVNGTYAYTVNPVTDYKVHEAGSVTVNGGAVTVTVTFTLVTYHLTFTESGLPSGTNWAVTIGATTTDSTSTTVVFALTNGTYSYYVNPVDYYARHANGSASISGAASSVSVAFVHQVYKVHVKEKGLPVATDWGIDLNGTPEKLSGNSFNVELTNGTFPFTVYAVPGFHPNGNIYTGDIFVAGSGSTLIIDWVKTTYKVTFTETGLPVGDSWTVKVGSKTITSSASSIQFHLANKTYSYTVTGPVGYTPTPASGTLTVAAAAVSESITFS